MTINVSKLVPWETKDSLKWRAKQINVYTGSHYNETSPESKKKKITTLSETTRQMTQTISENRHNWAVLKAYKSRLPFFFFLVSCTEMYRLHWQWKLYQNKQGILVRNDAPTHNKDCTKNTALCKVPRKTQLRSFATPTCAVVFLGLLLQKEK